MDNFKHIKSEVCVYKNNTWESTWEDRYENIKILRKYILEQTWCKAKELSARVYYRGPQPSSMHTYWRLSTMTIHKYTMIDENT